MKFLEKHPMYMIATGVVGISLSAIIVKYSDAPSLITAVYRLFFTVAMMTPVVFLNRSFRMELSRVSLRTVVLCAVSGIFLALHFVSWFESLAYTSVASSTVIVCTESIWVALGFCFLLRGRLKKKAVLSIAVTFAGSSLIAMSDYGSGSSLQRRFTCTLCRRHGGRLYAARPDCPGGYFNHGLYLYCIFFLRPVTICRRAYHPHTAHRLRQFIPDLRFTAGNLLHSARSQCFQLVPEVSLSGLCILFKAV